jgi:hypothetical protein
MTAIRLVTMAAFLLLLAFGADLGAGSRILDCSDAYPGFCFNDPGWCEDAPCDPDRGFVSDCVPAYNAQYTACEDENPNWCNDMFEVCNDICWENRLPPDPAYANGIFDFWCGQWDDCEAECICWSCYTIED